MSFQSPEFKLIWDEWIQYRKERKLPKYVPTGLKRTLAALFEDSGGNESVAIKMIEQSIKHNWQGIFKLKNDESRTGKDSKRGTSTDRIDALKNWGQPITGGS